MMKRHWTLIRKILEYVECYRGQEDLANPEVEGYSPAEVEYHVGLCREAGYLRAGNVWNALSPWEVPWRLYLTWQGHEALDSMHASEVDYLEPHISAGDFRGLRAARKALTQALDEALAKGIPPEVIMALVEDRISLHRRRNLGECC